MTANTVLLPDTVPVLRALRARGCRTAIVSTKRRFRIEDVLRKYEVADLLDLVIGFEDVQSPKPAPEGVLRAMEQLGARQRQTLYIGDSLIDAHAAANAGVDFAAVTTGTTSVADFEPLPHVRIAGSLSELFASLNPAQHTGCH